MTTLPVISATWLGKCLPKVASGGSGAMGEPWGSGVGSGVWDLGCFLGKRFLHDWASEQRSRRATAWKRLVWTSRSFLVFMTNVRNLRNPFVCGKSNTFSVNKSTSFSGDHAGDGLGFGGNVN